MGAPPSGGHRKDVALGRRFFAYVKPYRVRLAGALSLLFLTGALELAGPYLTKIAIDEGIHGGNAHKLALVCLAFAGVLVFEFLSAYFQDLFVVTAGQAVMLDLRRDVFAHLSRMGLAWFDRNPSGRIVTRVTSDVETLNELLTSGLVTILADVVNPINILGK